MASKYELTRAEMAETFEQSLTKFSEGNALATRLEVGRNQGFWNVVTYILGESSSDVNLVASTLRSIYDGEETYQEPLRILNFSTEDNKNRTNDIVRQYVNGMSLMPLPANVELKEMAAQISPDDGWHIFGKLYESLTKYSKH